MLSHREHMAGSVVLAALLIIVYDLLGGWFERWWAVALGLGVLFLPLFFVAQLIGVGIIWVYRRWFENRPEPVTTPDSREVP